MDDIPAEPHACPILNFQLVLVLRATAIEAGEEANPDSPKNIARLNVEHYRRLLASETAPAKRATIEKLLAEEEAKLRALEGEGNQHNHG